ncbi:TonB-dependent vitamin B12 receptor, partial [Pseudomonas aeruginosa]
FGVYDTHTATCVHALSDELRFTVTYGPPFKAPTINALYYTVYGNSDLDADTTRSPKVGLSSTHGWGHGAVNALRTNVDDLIG